MIRKILISLFLILSVIFQAQNEKFPKQVTEVVEKYLSSDTSNTRYMEMVKYKLYFLHKLETVVYKSQLTSIYIFGNADSHMEWYYVLFINEKNENNYTILGTEDNLLASMKMLREAFYDSQKISGQTVNSCYAYLMQNWEPKGMINTYPKDKNKK